VPAGVAPSPLALYVQVARRAYHRAATYRAATCAGLFTNTVFGFLRAYVLLAMFRSRADIASFDAVDAMTYTFLTQGLIGTMGIGGLDLADRIRTGDVVADLYRPMDFQSYWGAQDAGRFGFQVVFRGVPPFLAGAALFTLRLPPNVWTWLTFAASLVLAATVSFAWRFLVTLSGFWLTDTRGVVQLGVVVQFFLSGLLIPLNFFPEGIAHMLRLLPFAAIVQLPVEVFLGRHQGVVPAVEVLLDQAAWAAVLLLIGRWVTALAFRKVVVQGG
jgi:ABC-2 type transport system permease protein